MEQLRILAALCILLNIGVCVLSVTVTMDTDQQLLATEGQDYTINCNYNLETGETVDDIEWLKGNIKVFRIRTVGGIRWFDDFVSSSDPTVSTKGEYLGNPTSNTAHLKVKTIDRNDGGLYKCRVNTELGSSFRTDMKEVTVIVNILPAKPVITLSPRKTDFLAGESVTMTCEGNVGSPQGSLMLKQNVLGQWDTRGSLDDFKIVSNISDGTALGRVIFSKDLTADDDNAEFRCEAKRSSISGDVAQVSDSVVINVKQSVPVTKSGIVAKSTDMESQEKNAFDAGQSIQLKCDVSSYPTADITWIKDGQVKGNNVVLTLENVTPEMGGTYTCNATNVINGTKYTASQDVTVAVAEAAGTDVGMIAGIVIAVLVVIGVVAGVLIYIFVFKRKSGGGASKSNDREAGKGSELDGEPRKDEENDEEKKKPADAEAGRGFENINLDDSNRESNLNYAELDLRMRDETASDKPIRTEEPVEYAEIKKPEKKEGGGTSV